MTDLDVALPPMSIEAEQSLIGALLIDNSAWDRIDNFKSSDFYRDDHRVIFTAILDLIGAGKPADVLTVAERLKSINRLDDVGGLAYLGQIANETPSSASIKRYAEIVGEKATLRALLSAGDEIAASALNPDGSTADEVVSLAASKVNAIAEGRVVGKGPVPFFDALGEAVERMQATAEGKIKPYTTGLHDLDRLIPDYADGSLIVVGARPGMGKTSFALQCVIGARDDPRPGGVAVFSMEMPRVQLTYRLLAATARIPYGDIRDSTLTEEQWSALTYRMSVENIKKDLYIDDTAGLYLEQVRARCAGIARKASGLKLIVIDYIQLMRNRNENREQQISEISRGLKSLAKEFNCPVVALSQLNRSLEQRANKRPIMSDLRESGAIEQDADLIIFCYRDEVYNPDSREKGTAELIIGKQRNGPSGTSARVGFDGPHLQFTNLDYATIAALNEQVEEKPKRRVINGGLS